MQTRTPDCLTPRTGDATWRAPLDELDLAVRLETEGVTDEVARSVYGFKNTLQMAGNHLPDLGVVTPKSAKPAAAASAWREWLRGTVFALPMLLCALSMLTIGVSLWGGDLPADLASAVALATVSSLIVSGGFVQAMSRRALFYIGAGNYPAAAALAQAWGGAGFGFVLFTAVVGLAANVVFGWMPWALALHTALFYVLLGVLWLACGALYLVNRAIWIGGATVLGIVVVAGLTRGAGWALHNAQLAGVAAAVAVALGVSVSWFRARAGKGVPRSFLEPAREIFQAAPYFAYGALYYTFLFADRLIAWTAQTNAAALPLQFRGDYETALDLAMAAFVIQTGWVHASLTSFHEAVERVQRQLGAHQHREFNAAMRRFYFWRLARIAAYGFASSGLVFFLVSRFDVLPFPAMRPVLAIALAAYPIVVAGLWNASLLFALAQPQPVIASVTLGAVSSLGCGYVMSRTGSYESAVVGFLIGAFVFAAFSGFAVLRSVPKLDSDYYSSAL